VVNLNIALNIHVDWFVEFYRAMLRRARYCYGKSSACLSVCPWLSGIVTV